MPTYNDDENQPEDLPPDWAVPPPEPVEGAGVPMVQADPDYVPPELRLDRPAPVAAPDNRLAEAFARDRTKQNQDDLRNYLLAAGRREAPHLRNLGNPEATATSAQMAREPKPGDPMARELMALRVMEARKALEPKPTVGDPQRAMILELQRQKLEKELAAGGKPEKPNAFTPLTDDERAFWEKRVGPLPPNATLESVKTLQGSVQNPKVTQDIAREGLGIKRTEISKADAKEEANLEIPDWERDPKVRAAPDKVAQLRQAISESQVIRNDISKLADLIGRHGIVVDKSNPVQAEIEGYLKDLQLNLKGEAVYKLGVLSGPDMDILQKITGDPTAISLQNAMQGREGALTRLRGIYERTQSGLSAKLGANGYTRPGASVTAGEFTKNGKRYKTLPNGDLEEMD